MVTRRNLLVIVFVLLVAFIGGCAENTPPTQVIPNEPTKEQQQQAAIPDSQNTPLPSISQEKMTITVYNATQDATHLVAESHVVLKNEHPAQTAIELLVAGTKNAELLSVMPVGTKLRHISVKDNIAYVDFNDKLIKNNTGGSASEMLLVAAIVNTLTEFHNIQRVQILVEGKKIDTISGHMDIGEPLSRSEKIIKK
ncbi:MAG: Lipoprotein LpqB, GerMN protein [Firmicutes bacterium]|nr:Lipoprotein LpqB, GerMN protein [Bacillota bacterium]